MSRLNTLNVSEAISPFERALGPDYNKIVRDIKSLLGNVAKDVTVKHGDWKASAKFKLTAKDGVSVQLPMNNPASIMLCFGMRLNEISVSGKFDIQADIPKECLAWVEKHRGEPALIGDPEETANVPA